MEEKVANGKDECRKYNSERIRLDDNNKAEYGGYDCHSQYHKAVGDKSQKHTVRGGDSLASLELEQRRECMAEHRCYDNKGKEHIPEIRQEVLCEKNRNKTLAYVEQQAEYAELDADTAHNICHAGIVILAFFDDVNAAENLRDEVAVHYAARGEARKRKKQIFYCIEFHWLHLS